MVEGETLEKIVQREGKLSPAAAVAYAVRAAEGLENVHQQGLFHGLLKPSNLMIGTDGTVRILDFGIGCLLAETEGESLVDTMSTANSVSNGLDCASPESIMDPTNLTAVGDQYSLGCVLYFCLTGQYPFPDGSAVEKMMAHQTKTPQPVKELNPAVPDGLIEVVNKLLAKTPNGRFAAFEEVVSALQPFAMEPARGGRPAPNPPPTATPVPTKIPKAPATPDIPRAIRPPEPIRMPSRQSVLQELPVPVAKKSMFGGYQAPPGLIDDPSEDRNLGPFGFVALAMTFMGIFYVVFMMYFRT